MKPPSAPERGDLAWVSLDPQAGHEQSGRRPVLVLSPRTYNSKVGLALCCPVTSAVKGYPFEVPLPPGSALGGIVLADQVKSLDWRARKAEVAGRVAHGVVAEVLAKLNTLLGGQE